MANLNSIIIATAVTTAVWWFFLRKKRSDTPQQEVKLYDANASDAPKLPEWIEIISANGQRIFAGKRVGNLAPYEFGQGACAVVGFLYTNDLDPQLLPDIEKLHPSANKLGGGRVLVLGLARPGQTETLIMGPLNDEAIETEVRNALSAAGGSVEVRTEINSDTVGLMNTEQNRAEFDEVWRQYVTAWALRAI